MFAKVRSLLGGLLPKPEQPAPVLTIKEVAAQLGRERRLKRLKDADPAYAEAVFTSLYGREPPEVLRQFYAERIGSIADMPCEYPTRATYKGDGWKPLESWVNGGLDTDFVPLFGDGCGNSFALDLSDAHIPAVYFFDHEQEPSGQPSEVEASSLARFLLILARTNQLDDEQDRDSGRTPLLDSLDLKPAWSDPRDVLLRKLDPDLERIKRAFHRR